MAFLIESFENVARYLSHPLILIGFVLLLFFAIHRLLIRSGIIPPLKGKEGGKVVQTILRYGFVAAVLTILLGFGLKAWQLYVERGVDESGVALEQVKREISDNFITLSVTTGTIAYRKPEPFWDTPRPNETLAAYEERARNFFRDYVDELRQIKAETTYSDQVYRSFRHDLSGLDSDTRNYVKTIYEKQAEVLDALNRLESGLRHLLGLEMRDRERFPESRKLHLEKLLEAKIQLLSASAYYCLVIEEAYETAILMENLARAGIVIELEKGEPGSRASLQQAAQFQAEKSKVIASWILPETSPNPLELPDGEMDPYLKKILEQSGSNGLSTNSTPRLPSGTDIDTEETDPVKLLQMAAMSYIRSDGRASIVYLEKALEAEGLNKVQRLFIELSIDRLKHPDKYENGLGIMVLRIDPDGAFQKADIQVGDVLITMDGKTIVEPLNIASAIANEGQNPIVLKIFRDNEIIKKVIRGGESAGAALSQLVILQAVQL